MEEIVINGSTKIELDTSYGFGNQFEHTVITVVNDGERCSASLRRDDILKLIDTLIRQL